MTKAELIITLSEILMDQPDEIIVDLIEQFNEMEIEFIPVDIRRLH
tara:strand:- start:410 stop:547 length:138 start_codon:yes stop_codon:yes gene_type:complete